MCTAEKSAATEKEGEKEEEFYHQAKYRNNKQNGINRRRQCSDLNVLSEYNALNERFIWCAFCLSQFRSGIRLCRLFRDYVNNKFV